MAERLEVTKSWLSRYLELARLPLEVIAAFGSSHVVGISHAATLAPLLRLPEKRDRILGEARVLATEQADLSQVQAAFLLPGVVVQRLVKATTARPRQPARVKTHVVRTAEGAILARGQKAGRGGGVAITIPAPAKYERAALMQAVEEILDELGPQDLPRAKLP
jgi:ParB family chromosome partitioning protein